MEFLVLINTFALIFAGSALMYVLFSKSRNRAQNPVRNEK
jgi:hypothetical protein